MLYGDMAEELRIASERHLEKLVDYLERYPTLAITSVRSREGLLRSQYMWEKIALNLNKLDTRVKKSGKAWFRYWLEWKIKIRHKYIQYQRSRAGGNGHQIEFTTCEERLLKIMTDRDGNLLAPSLFLKKEGPLNANNNNSPVHEEATPINNGDIYMQELTEAPMPQKKSIEELRRELVELELRKQKELFEIEKKQKREKHEMEMAILELRRQLLVKELDKT